MATDGWIKLHRKFSDWEWFNISEMVHLFIFLLTNANHQDGEWRGINIKRGQILTGLNSLNHSTKISIQTLRTCLKRLEKTQEINIKITNKYSIITICKYEDYQSDQQTTNKQPNKQLTFNQQATNNKQEEEEECKEEKEIKLNKFNFRKELVILGVSEKIISDWLAVRKGKKAVNTETALNAIKEQIKLSGLSANECIKIASENSWSGLKAKWIENLNTTQNGKTINNNSKGKLAGTYKAAEEFAREIEEKN